MLYYANSEVDVKNIKKRFFYIFSEKNKSKISIHKLNFYKNFTFIECLKVFPLSVYHGDLPILGFRIEDFAYITDASNIPFQTIQQLKGLKILVLNVLREIPKHPSHFTLSESLKEIQKISPKKAYLTHISHMLGFHKEIETQLPNNVYLAYDGLIIQ